MDETDIVSGSGTIFRIPVSVSIQCQNGQLILKMVKCRILGVTHIPVSDKTHFNLILSAFMIPIFNKAINFQHIGNHSSNQLEGIKLTSSCKSTFNLKKLGIGVKVLYLILPSGRYLPDTGAG